MAEARGPKEWERYGGIEINMWRAEGGIRRAGFRGGKQYDVTSEVENQDHMQIVQAASPADAGEVILECYQRRFAHKTNLPVKIKGAVEHRVAAEKE